jgi:hypothetical protein
MKHFYRVLSGILFVLFIIGSINVYSQQGSIKGKVIDSGTGKAVEYAYILNYSLHKSIYSNTNGEFYLNARQGDTLVMYGVGYYYLKIIVDDKMLGTQYVTAFELRQQAYELSEARIIGMGTYDDFRQQFLALNQPKTKTDILSEYIAEVSRTAAVEAYEKAKAEQRLNGITFVSVPILTPEEKERIKLAGIINKEKVRDQIYQKYNPVVVKKITGLSDDDEIIEFMVYCNFPDNYLLGVTEYDLMTRITLKYEMFKRKKQDEKLMENPVNCIDDILNSIA